MVHCLLLHILEKQHVTTKPLQAFTIMDQNRDGFIDKNDLRDTFAALGRNTYVPVYVCLSLLCCEGFTSSYFPSHVLYLAVELF